MRAVLLITAAVGLSLVPHLAVASGDDGVVDVTVDVSAGATRFAAQSFKAGTGCSSPGGGNLCSQGMLDGALLVGGITAVVRWNRWELGALVDGAGEYDTIRTRSGHLGALAGWTPDLVSWLRVEALGELGAHLVDDIGLAGTNAYAGDMRAWLPYAGMRGGVSVRPRLAGPVRLVVGVWAFARVDLAHKDATVALTHPTGSALYDVGGWNLGWAARFGFELYSKLS